MGVMAKASQVILLVEDSHQQQFIFRYLSRLGFGTHAMRVVKSPSGAGSAEHWIRERFAIEVEAYRRRQAQTKLVVLIDADAYSVPQRIQQLDEALRDAGTPPISAAEDAIARLVPRRNIETWSLCLNCVRVDEDNDYKRMRDNWSEQIRTAGDAMYAWTRPNAVAPPVCVESLRSGIGELQEAGLC